jgi:HPt (histidine-containing phosphotransfer) domain-containing protein
MSAPDLPVLDPTTVSEVQALGAELLAEIVDLFVTDVPIRLSRLRAAVADRAGDAIRREAHGLKGGALGVGAARMASICGAIERLAGAGDVDRAAALEASIDPAFAEARLALEDLCRRDPAA